MSSGVYYVYIVTNKTKTVLYTRRTNDLRHRLVEHWLQRGNGNTFTGRHNCHNLLYFESTKYVLNAIERERQIKGWIRKKKEAMISDFNPEWKFLNEEIMEWPPEFDFHRKEL